MSNNSEAQSWDWSGGSYFSFFQKENVCFSKTLPALGLLMSIYWIKKYQIILESFAHWKIWVILSVEGMSILRKEFILSYQSRHIFFQICTQVKFFFRVTLYWQSIQCLKNYIKRLMMSVTLHHKVLMICSANSSFNELSCLKDKSMLWNSKW